MKRFWVIRAYDYDGRRDKLMAQVTSCRDEATSWKSSKWKIWDSWSDEMQKKIWNLMNLYIVGENEQMDFS